MANEYAYIPDGFTLEGYIAAEEGFHPELNFIYRPIKSREQYVISSFADKDPPELLANWRAKACSRHILSWDMTDPISGQPVPISYETLLDSNPLLFQKLYSILCCMRASDPKPGTKDKEKTNDMDTEEMDRIFSRLQDGENLSQEEAQQKNSVAG